MVSGRSTPEPLARSSPSFLVIPTTPNHPWNTTALDRHFTGTINRTAAESIAWASERSILHQRTNIVMIVLDDAGYAEFGCYGPDIETPALDSLAADGLRYAKFHVTPLCSPTRTCLLTGRRPVRPDSGGLSPGSAWPTAEIWGSTALPNSWPNWCAAKFGRASFSAAESRVTKEQCPESLRRPASPSKPVSRSSSLADSADSADAHATSRRPLVSSSVGPVHEMTGPDAIVFGKYSPDDLPQRSFRQRKTSSWPGHPTSRKQWLWWTEVSVESAEVKTPMHKVFISYHHANDQRHKNALVDSEKRSSMLLMRIKYLNLLRAAISCLHHRPRTQTSTSSPLRQFLPHPSMATRSATRPETSASGFRRRQSAPRSPPCPQRTRPGVRPGTANN